MGNLRRRDPGQEHREGQAVAPHQHGAKSNCAEQELSIGPEEGDSENDFVRKTQSRFRNDVHSTLSKLEEPALLQTETAS